MFTPDDPIYDPDSTFLPQKETKGYQFKGEVFFDTLNTRGGVQYVCSGGVWGLLLVGLMFNLYLISFPLRGLNLLPLIPLLPFQRRGTQLLSTHPAHGPSGHLPLAFTAAPKELAPLQGCPPPGLSPGYLASSD